MSTTTTTVHLVALQCLTRDLKKAAAMTTKQARYFVFVDTYYAVRSGQRSAQATLVNNQAASKATS